MIWITPLSVIIEEPILTGTPFTTGANKNRKKIQVLVEIIYTNSSITQQGQNYMIFLKLM